MYRNFPLFSIHPQAQKAAEAAECAGEQGKYWDMHALLFEQQDQWSGSADAEATFQQMAADLGVDQAQFDACLAGGNYADKVMADYQEGVSEGIQSTPNFRINGAPLAGAQPFEAFQRQIDYYLAGGEPPTQEVSADSYRSMGDPDAPVVVTEFSDFLCPYCAQITQEVIPDLIEQYVDTGKVRFVYREFPLTSIHPNSQKASEAAVCAGRQGSYWEMNEKLFATQDEWGAQADPTGQFKGYAEELGLDTGTFAECLDSGAAAIEVQGEFMAGEMLGVNATPYFFVGGIAIRGGLPLESLGKIIDYVAVGGTRPEIVPTNGDWHVRGDLNTAQAVTVAFVDYTSPESGQHARDVLPELMSTYVDTGQALYVLHPWSQGQGTLSAQAAAAAECAGEQGEFWGMHEKLFSEQDTWLQAADPRPLFASYAESLGLDASALETCLDSDWAKLRVLAGNVVGALYGVPTAPVFLFNNGQGQQGSPSFEEFQTVFESILNP